MVADDESVTVRVLKEVNARLRYGQPCTELHIGPDLWQEIRAKEYRHIRRDSYGWPYDVVTTYLGLFVTVDPSLAPTCFEIR
jgi:hypothetical protein